MLYLGQEKKKGFKMLEIILIVFAVVFAYKFFTMRVTWLRVGIVASFIGLYFYGVGSMV